MMNLKLQRIIQKLEKKFPRKIDLTLDRQFKILKKLGIELGFKQIMTIEPEKGMNKVNNSFLEIARQDHAEIVKRMS